MKTRSMSIVILTLLLTLLLPESRLQHQPLWSSSSASASTVAVPTNAELSVAKQDNVAIDDLHSSPLMFIENVGQFADAARFQIRMGNNTIWLTEDAIWITVAQRTSTANESAPLEPGKLRFASREGADHESITQKTVNIKLSFVDGNQHPQIEAYDRLNTVVSFFIGNNPEKWRPDVPVWGGIRYAELYPGLDLDISSENGQLVPRLIAQPDTDIRAVRLRVEGAEAVTVDGDSLRLSTIAGEFTLPLLQVEGVRGKPEVQPLGVQEFDVSAPFAVFPPNLPPTIEDSYSPADNPDDLLYGSFLGGISGDEGHGITVDNHGTMYITGETWSGHFPDAAGYDTTLQGYMDVFVVKIANTGAGLIYATFVGGNQDDDGNNITVDELGAAYITGSTVSEDFPVGPGYDTTHNSIDPILGSLSDAFVMKLNLSGTHLVYSTFLGGYDLDSGVSIAVDSAHFAYVTGFTGSENFPVGPGYDTSFNRGICYEYLCPDAFVVKLTPSGTALSYATFLGGTRSDAGWDIVVDSAGAVVVTGRTNSADFPAIYGYDTSYNIGVCGSIGTWISYCTDAFVVKLSPTGTEMMWGTFIGGNDSDGSTAIASDATGSVYVTGHSSSMGFPTTPGAFDRTYNGGDFDTFVVKLNSAGNTLIYSTFMGGSGDDVGYAIGRNEEGYAYVTGSTSSIDFPTTQNALDRSYNGAGSGLWYPGDTFVIKLNATGNGLTYGTFLGGSDNDGGTEIALDGAGRAFITGMTESINFPTTPGAFDRSHNGYGDAFVVKLGMGSTYYKISGLVRDTNGNPLPGVTISADTATSTQTDATGYYSLYVPAGTHLITASQDGYAFCPRQYGVTLPPMAIGRNFTGFGAEVALGFCPTTNGYRFCNGPTPRSCDEGWGIYPESAHDYGVEELIRTFGQNAVCWMNGSYCIIRPQASAFEAEVNTNMNGGHCDGMASTALRLFKGRDLPSDLQPGANSAHDLDLAHARRYIAYYHIRQWIQPLSGYINQARQNAPSTVLGQLYFAMLSNSPSPSTMILIDSVSMKRAHAVTPFAIENRGGGIYWVRVYDNNYPNDMSRYVIINVNTETWSYHLGGTTTYSGDASTKTLAIIPILMYEEPPVCPWCSVGVETGSTEPNTMQQVWFSGNGHILIEDSQGRRLGYSGGHLYEEIPDAFAALGLGGLEVDIEPVYYLPASGNYTILLDGQTLEQTQSASISQYGPGYAVGIDEIALTPGSQDHIFIAADGTQIIYQAGANRNANFTLALDRSNASYELQINGATINGSKTTTITANQAGQLVYSQAQGTTGSYGIYVERVEATGVQVFAHNDVAITANDTHYVEYANWGGAETMTLNIDQSSNGTIDQTIQLTNQVQRIYLPGMRDN